MRKWLQSRDTDFIEVSCDEEAEHITKDMLKRVEEPIKATEPQEEDRRTDWDTKYAKMLRER